MPAEADPDLLEGQLQRENLRRRASRFYFIDTLRKPTRAELEAASTTATGTTATVSSRTGTTATGTTATARAPLDRGRRHDVGPELEAAQHHGDGHDGHGELEDGHHGNGHNGNGDDHGNANGHHSIEAGATTSGSVPSQ